MMHALDRSDNTADAATPEAMRLADYRPPEFSADAVDLSFKIFSDHTVVQSRVEYKRTPEGKGASFLILDAQSPNPPGQPYIRSILRDGQKLQSCESREELDKDRYFWDEEKDRLYFAMPSGTDTIALEIQTHLEPQHNTALSGFYRSDRCFVTQCESEGFRRITPFLDRPDVMARYRVSLEGPLDLCPTLLANGNEVEKEDLGNGRHRAIFEDPWPKPCYLFATANGEFDWIEDHFNTMGGRKVRLRVYTDTRNAEKGWHAMDSLKRAMKWDEDTFGCEYDLDDYGVVAVSKFSMGAMENKGLNVFRDSLVLASPETATDDDYQNIIDVIGHEYFHNYSGNRITNRNWFNLSLKEGLTVNREQLFTAFTTSSALERISAVQVLRRAQFPEDDGPNAHPVMPPEIRAVDNIYSATVYIKGSEVIRMMKTMMGEQKFIEGVKHYFRAYDGQAVTIQEFIHSMEAVSGLNLSGQFQLWYTQSGRPQIKVRGHYDPEHSTYTLEMEQDVPVTRDQSEKQSMIIPVATALVDEDGNNIPFRLNGKEPAGERVLELSEKKQSFVLEGVDRPPSFHSLLRGFSAPVDLDPGLSEAQLHEQLRKDTDGFNRWDAGQKLALREMEQAYRQIQSGESATISEPFLESLRMILHDSDLEPNLKAAALSLPGINELEFRVKPVDPKILVQVTDLLRRSMAQTLRHAWREAFEWSRNGTSGAYEFTYHQTGLRRIKRLAIFHLAESGQSDDLDLARELYEEANNMSDRISAMAALTHHDCDQRQSVFEDFYSRFQSDSLTIQKFFSQSAMARGPGLLNRLTEILERPAFNWEIPGHVQSLFRSFVANYRHYHAEDGSGYRFLAEAVQKECRINGTTAAGLVSPLGRWKDYSGVHAEMMLAQLKQVKADLEAGRQNGTVQKADAAPVLDQIDRALPTEG